MRKIEKKQTAELLSQLEKGEISLQDLKANQLGIGSGGVHFCIKGYEHLGCLDPVQIDELVTSGEKETLVPCEGAYFYTPLPGSMILDVGTIPYNISMSDAPRKPSLYAHFAVLTEFGIRSPAGNFDEKAHHEKSVQRIIERRKELHNIFKKS